MNPGELEQYLHDHIPLSRAMAVGVKSASIDSVVLNAPLAPNINHRNTIFGGSASAVAILAAWSLLLLKTKNEGLDARLVIQRNSIEYLEPIVGDFSVRSQLEKPEQWPRFVQMFTRRGRARVSVTTDLFFQEKLVGQLTGEFVALSKTTN